jgi:hypothetical protein
VNTHLRAVNRIVTRAQLASLTGNSEAALVEARAAHALLGIAIAAAENQDFAEAIAVGLVKCERAALLERLVSDTEPFFSSERDTRHHDSDSDPMTD